MGAPKQKWTSEEEAALKAGIAKHGPGKWRTILKDPEFSGVLFSRSNVDLKDKWRNMGVTANGFGTRDKARLALKKNKVVFKPEENSLALSTVVQCEEEIIDANDAKCHGKEGPNTKPQKNLFQEAEIPQEAASKKIMLSEIPQEAASKKSIPRLDTIILEAITNLKEPTGSNRVAIATYIEDRYFAPLNFKRVLTAKLALLTTSAKLIKVKRKYRIAPSSFCSEENKSSGVLLMEEKQKDSPTGPSTEKDDIKILTKAQIDAELSKMRNMTAQEAAVAAARAVAEAEAALAEAEEAEKEAEAAEADAEAAQAFAEAAMTTLKNRNTSKLTAVHA